MTVLCNIVHRPSGFHPGFLSRGGKHSNYQSERGRGLYHSLFKSLCMNLLGGKCITLHIRASVGVPPGSFFEFYDI